MSDWIDVAAATGFPPGSRRCVEADGVEIVVFNIDGHFHAIEDLCSHAAYPLSDGVLEGCELSCALHGARFSVITGAALSPPAYEPVAVFPVRVEGGRVQVRDDRFD